MGWAGGSRLADDVWDVIRDLIPDSKQRALTAREIIKLFEHEDCDTIDEAEILCEDAGKKRWLRGMTCEIFEALPEYTPLEDM